MRVYRAKDVDCPVIEIARIGAGAGSAGRRLLSTLHAACFEDCWNEESMGRLLAVPGTFAAVASLTPADATGTRPAGLAVCRVAEAEAEILTLGVIPDCRRAGVASRLVNECRLIAAGAGAAQMFLEVAADNTAALALYTSHGFRRAGRRANYYRSQEKRSTSKDALILRLDLT